MKPEKQVLTTTEAARIFGVSPRTLRKYVDRGLLPGIRLGRRVFIPVEALRRLLGAEVKAKEGEEGR